LFDRRVRQVEPLLHEVDAQHHFQRVRPASVASLRVVGYDQVGEDLPGNAPFHLCQELLAARHLALACKFGVGKAQLAHWGLPDWVSFNNLHSDRSRGLVQTFLRLPAGRGVPTQKITRLTTAASPYPALLDRKRCCLAMNASDLAKHAVVQACDSG